MKQSAKHPSRTNTDDCLDLIIKHNHSTYSIHVPYVASATDLTHELQKITVTFTKLMVHELSYSEKMQVVEL